MSLTDITGNSAHRQIHSPFQIHKSESFIPCILLTRFLCSYKTPRRLNRYLLLNDVCLNSLEESVKLR